jgi:hypothetical protein
VGEALGRRGDAEAASQLFQVVTRRYEHGSIILTTNRHIANWGEIFADTTPAIAILDRVLHHASVISINGDSYRMRAHRDAINALRPATPAFSGTPNGARPPQRRMPVARPGVRAARQPTASATGTSV